MLKECIFAAPARFHKIIETHTLSRKKERKY
jgi:hypothetical protein